MEIVENFKMKVSNPDQIKTVQRILSSMGLLEKFLSSFYYEGICYRYHSKQMTGFGNTNVHFDDHEHKEITYDEFIEKYDIFNVSTKNVIITTDIMFKFIEYYMDHLNDEKTPQELFKDWKND
jgi:hypothetical protein